MATHSADVLVIGSGIAGLSLALEAATDAHVTIVTKRSPEIGSTWLAQGGISAAVGADDNVDRHVQDTMLAGDGLCDETVVRAICSQGPPDSSTTSSRRVVKAPWGRQARRRQRFHERGTRLGRIGPEIRLIRLECRLKIRKGCLDGRDRTAGIAGREELLGMSEGGEAGEGQADEDCLHI